MNNPLVSMSVDEGTVRSVLEKQIQAAIVANLGAEEDLIAKAVTMALSMKVTEDGGVSRYSSDNKYDFLEVVTSTAIREAAKKALDQWCKDNAEKVHAAVLKEMRKPSRVNSIAKAFADAAEQSVRAYWTPKVTVAFTPPKD